MNRGLEAEIIITPLSAPVTSERSGFELPLPDRFSEGPPGFPYKTIPFY